MSGAYEPPEPCTIGMLRLHVRGGLPYPVAIYLDKATLAFARKGLRQTMADWAVADPGLIKGGFKWRS